MRYSSPPLHESKTSLTNHDLLLLCEILDQEDVTTMQSSWSFKEILRY